MDNSSTSRLVPGLRALLTTTAGLVTDVTDADWHAPLTSSQADAEMRAQEAHRPPPETGSWPWLAAPLIARLALQVALEQARGFSAVLDQEATCYAADALCRAVLEPASLAWWLLEPDIDAERRLARALVYRLNTAKATSKAIDQMGLGHDEDRSGYGELPEHVEQEITSLGPTWTVNRSRTQVRSGTSRAGLF